MAARALVLVALVAAAALAGAAQAQDPVLPIQPPPRPELPWLPIATPVEVPATPTPPGIDAPPGGLGGEPVPTAPGFAGPDGNWGATYLVAGLAGFGALAGLAVWGGTRFRGTEEILEHEVRSAIYAYVQEHVGASLKDITDHLGLSTTNAVWHLRKLEEGGLVRGRKFNGAKIYYPTSGGVQARNLSMASAALTNGNARTILAFIHAHPGAHQREVARLLDVNHGTVRWHLRKLRDAELLEERRTGASATYHATTLGAEALQVVQARTAAAPAAQALPEPAALPAAGQA
ncbi:MAG TPA: helix-turn-helix domain-containing protein [Candidatus Thermoplasmatota archaeon]|jgi:predicted transcriptional regulator|nr:helix-turn-helix domain-containing protein [Candidatus Thermoplasmatota archaeon]